MSLPPRWVRRVVLAPLMVLFGALVLSTLPLTAAVIAFTTRYLPGRLRAVGVIWLFLVWIVHEVASILLLFVLWVISGFGWKLDRPWFRDRHVRLLGWYVWSLVGTCQSTLGLRIVTERAPGELVVEPERTSRPALVMSRHAGAGDSFLLAHLLVNTFDRVPAVVLKDTLQLLPSIDIALNRFPNAFISPNPPAGAGVVERIAALSAGLQPDGALVIFPEGGNFSEGRRTRAIQRLVDRGLGEFVPRATALTNVLPPRPGGVLAALDANPEADVVMVAHTGLEDLSSAGGVLANLPMRRSVRLSIWYVPREDIPLSTEDRTDWLYAWWERIDTWIDEHSGRSPIVAGEGSDEGADGPV